MAKKETKVQPDDIRVACADGNVKAVKWLLNNLKETGNLTIDRINDEKYGKTSLMEAARGNGYGGEKYRKIIQKLWKAYRETGEDNSAIKQVLLKKDDRHKWITLMHSAKCGDEINLNLILSFYSEMSLSDLSNEIDWVNVDPKVKPIITNNISILSSTRTGKRMQRKPDHFRFEDQRTKKKQKKESSALLESVDGGRSSNYCNIIKEEDSVNDIVYNDPFEIEPFEIDIKGGQPSATRASIDRDRSDNDYNVIKEEDLSNDIFCSKPHDNDVKGGHNREHPGNKRFLQIVSKYALEKGKKVEEKIFQDICNQTPAGRFFDKDNKNTLSKAKALQKIKVTMFRKRRQIFSNVGEQVYKGKSPKKASENKQIIELLSDEDNENRLIKRDESMNEQTRRKFKDSATNAASATSTRDENQHSRQQFVKTMAKYKSNTFKPLLSKEDNSTIPSATASSQTTKSDGEEERKIDEVMQVSIHAKQQETKYCIHCGCINKVIAKYCVKCGQEQ